MDLLLQEIQSGLSKHLKEAKTEFTKPFKRIEDSIQSAADSFTQLQLFVNDFEDKTMIKILPNEETSMLKLDFDASIQRLDLVDLYAKMDENQPLICSQQKGNHVLNLEDIRKVTEVTNIRDIECEDKYYYLYKYMVMSINNYI